MCWDLFRELREGLVGAWVCCSCCACCCCLYLSVLCLWTSEWASEHVCMKRTECLLFHQKGSDSPSGSTRSVSARLAYSDFWIFGFCIFGIFTLGSVLRRLILTFRFFSIVAFLFYILNILYLVTVIKQLRKYLRTISSIDEITWIQWFCPYCLFFGNLEVNLVVNKQEIIIWHKLIFLLKIFEHLLI